MTDTGTSTTSSVMTDAQIIDAYNSLVTAHMTEVAQTLQGISADIQTKSQTLYKAGVPQQLAQVKQNCDFLAPQLLNLVGQANPGAAPAPASAPASASTTTPPTS